jgi:hypothetical protein
MRMDACYKLPSSLIFFSHVKSPVWEEKQNKKKDERKVNRENVCLQSPSVSCSSAIDLVIKAFLNFHHLFRY